MLLTEPQVKKRVCAKGHTLVTRHQQTQFDQLKTGDSFKFERDDKITWTARGNGWYGRPYSGGPWLMEDTHRRYQMVYEVISIDETGCDMTGWEALEAQSVMIGWPSHYTDDLYLHDRVSIATNQPTCFGWSVRDCGTHLMLPNCCYSLWLTYYLDMSEGTGSDSREFFWSGKSLREMECKKIRERLLSASHPLMRYWNQHGYSTMNDTGEMSVFQEKVNKALAQ